MSRDEFVEGPVTTASNPQVLKDYNIIDTVGAGDCFTASYVVRHSELDWSNKEHWSDNYRQAMRFGNSAAFLCITRNGAMPAMPSRQEVDNFIQHYHPQ